MTQTNFTVQTRGDMKLKALRKSGVVPANIFGEGFQDKYIPSFRWGKKDTTELEKFFGTIEKMKQRRGKSLNPNEKIYLTKLYEKQF